MLISALSEKSKCQYPTHSRSERSELNVLNSLYSEQKIQEDIADFHKIN